MNPQNLALGTLNHIGLPTADPDRSARFYCEVLGFRLVRRPAFSFDGRWLYREEVGPMIHLIHDASHKPPQGEINTRGSHFAMQCCEIDRAIAQLEAHGIKSVERVLPDHGYRQIFFHDLDGNVVELGEWPDVHKFAEALKT